ncbi:MAG: PAS domain S-box protein [Desulfobaccales bacterium]
MDSEAVFEDLERGLFIVDQRRRIMGFNRRAQEITGFPKEEALGRHCWEVLQGDRCQEGCFLRATLEDGAPPLTRAYAF